MLSLQTPQKVGQSCLIFSKADGVNQLINRYLVRDPDSRKKILHITTYGVVPPNEDYGFVGDLIRRRPLVLRIYREVGVLMSNAELRKMTLPATR